MKWWRKLTDTNQLELNLEVALEEATETPEQADVLSLWAQFEGGLAGLEQRDHLRVAGDILVQLYSRRFQLELIERSW